jgi:hypothetical protein
LETLISITDAAPVPYSGWGSATPTYTGAPERKFLSKKAAIQLFVAFTTDWFI